MNQIRLLLPPVFLPIVASDNVSGYPAASVIHIFPPPPTPVYILPAYFAVPFSLIIKSTDDGSRETRRRKDEPDQHVAGKQTCEPQSPFIPFATRPIGTNLLNSFS